MGTLLHELGHTIYQDGIDRQSLPYDLRDDPQGFLNEGLPSGLVEAPLCPFYTNAHPYLFDGKRLNGHLDLSRTSLRNHSYGGSPFWYFLAKRYTAIANSDSRYDEMSSPPAVPPSYSFSVTRTMRGYAGEVWLSYDPNGDSENGDAAALIVLAPPSTPGGKFRVIERRQFKGSRFDEQAEVIRKYTKRYRVTKIDIDRTGIGDAVFQLVQTFFPTVTGHNYDAFLKTQMVYKALDVILKNRLEFDVFIDSLREV